MSGTLIRVLLHGDPRWVPVLMDGLAEAGVWCARYESVRAAVRRLGFKPALDQMRATILHQVSVPVASPRGFKPPLFFGKRTVAHWIGSDVMNLRSHVTRQGALPPFLSRQVDAHLADSPALQEELAALGLCSTVIRLLPKLIEAEVQPLPATPAVLSYWGDSRAAFYGSDVFMSLAKAFPDMSFYVVGATGKNMDDVPENVRFLGNVADMDSVYRKATALFRFVEHDSLSAMVLEALARGRHVLYSHPFPHTARISGLQDAGRALEQIRQAPSPNVEGANYVRRNFSRREEMRKLKAYYDRLLSTGRAGS